MYFAIDDLLTPTPSLTLRARLEVSPPVSSWDEMLNRRAVEGQELDKPWRFEVD